MKTMDIKKVCGFLVIGIFLVVGCARFKPIEKASLQREDGLIAYYPFNGNADDESGNGNNGTVYGATLTEDRYGNLNKAYKFEGDDYITIPDSISLGSPETAVSIAVWVKLFNASFGHIIAKQYKGIGLPYAYQYDSYALWVGGNLFFSVCDSEYLPNQQPRVYTPINTNEWLHIVGVWDSSISKMSIYINGQIKTNSVFNGFKNIAYDNSPCLLGADDNDANDIPDGFIRSVIDEIRIYNRALSVNEIMDLYMAEK